MVMRTNRIVYLIIFVLLIELSCLSCQGINRQAEQKYPYWENLSEVQKDKILSSNKIGQSVIKLYNGTLSLQDNDESKQLLDTLTNLNGENTPLYFYLFNHICSSPDGAIAELMGEYCQKILLNAPVYVFTYLSKDEILLKKYAEYLGYELYFKEEGTSGIKYNYKDFKGAITKKLKNTDNLHETLILFYSEIENTLKEMD